MQMTLPAEGQDTESPEQEPPAPVFGAGAEPVGARAADGAVPAIVVIVGILYPLPPAAELAALVGIDTEAEGAAEGAP